MNGWSWLEKQHGLTAVLARPWRPSWARFRMRPITLALIGPTGLIRVNTLKTSGDVVLDKSFQMAVKEAAPYTLPDDSDVAPYLRSFSLTLKPPW
jgi:hypothetical protein